VHSDPDIRALQAHFNDIASALFQEASNSFRNEAARTNRDGKENVYQLLRSKHCQYFRRSLQQQADAILARCDKKEMQLRLRAYLGESIRYFEAEFLRKTDEF
jgi:hypothetical protein